MIGQVTYRRDNTYVEVAPCKELAPYIKCFWGSDTPYEDNFETGGKPIIIIGAHQGMIYGLYPGVGLRMDKNIQKKNY